MSDFVQKVKTRIDDIRKKPWAEPTAMALKTTGKIINGLSPFPGSSILAGAFGLGASVLNPDPTLADLRRTEESIKLEIKQNFEEISSEMRNMKYQLNNMESKIDEVLAIITDSHFKSGIEKIAAVYENFVDGQGSIDNMFLTFQYQAGDLQTTFTQHCNVSKMFT